MAATTSHPAADAGRVVSGTVLTTGVGGGRRTYGCPGAAEAQLEELPADDASGQRLTTKQEPDKTQVRATCIRDGHGRSQVGFGGLGSAGGFLGSVGIPGPW